MFTLVMVYLGATEQEREGKKSAKLKFHDQTSNEVFEFYTADENILKLTKTLKMYQPHAVMLKMATKYNSNEIVIRFLDAQPQLVAK